MSIYRTRDRVEAARFIASLAERGYERFPSAYKHAVPAGCYRSRVDPRGRFLVVYTERGTCATPGHENVPATTAGYCEACYCRMRYWRDERVREQKRAASRRWYARLTPEQRQRRLARQRAAKKLKRWAA